MGKKRIFLINGKRIVEGDPNLVTNSEILLKTIKDENGAEKYDIQDNEGNSLIYIDGEGGGEGQEVPKFLYSTTLVNSGTLYMNKISTAYDFAEKIMLNRNAPRVVSDEYPDSGNARNIYIYPYSDIEDPYSLNLASSMNLNTGSDKLNYLDYNYSNKDEVMEAIKNFCDKNSSISAGFYGPYIGIVPGGYTADTSIRIGVGNFLSDKGDKFKDDMYVYDVSTKEVIHLPASLWT